MKDIINCAVGAAKEAGKLLADNFSKPIVIESKGDRNLATNLDKEAEGIIIDKIKSKFPLHGILAEEGGSKNTGNEYLWIIDPLDGTHNYIRGINLFGVSIGVVYKNDFIAGVIYMPLSNELYVGEKGNGSYKNNKKIYVSQKKDLKECYVSFDSALRYAPKKMLPALGELAKECFNVRMFGSSVRVLSYIAEGKLDAAVEFFDKPWDFAAGVCLIQEAKGKFAGLKGEKISPRSPGYIASNSNVYNKIKKIVVPYS